MLQAAKLTLDGLAATVAVTPTLRLARDQWAVLIQPEAGLQSPDGQRHFVDFA
jgi:hypothetical protein